MNRIIFFNLLLIISCSSEITEKENPELQYNLKSLNVFGKIKSITEYDYKQYVPDSLINFYVSNNDCEFDKNGNIISEKTKLINQEPYFRKYIYDKMGNMIERSKKDENHKDFITQTKYSLNADGKIREETQLIYGSDSYSKMEYEYDKFGNKTKMKDLHSHNPYEINYENTYNKSNMLVKTIIRNDNNKPQTIYEYKYDKNRLIEKKTESVFANIIDIEKHVYDNNGRLIVLSFEKNGRIVNEEKYKYDDFGNLIEIIVFAEGKIKFINSHIYKYKYDKKNNWVHKETYFMDSTLVKEISREIKYF